MLFSAFSELLLQSTFRQFQTLLGQNEGLCFACRVFDQAFLKESIRDVSIYSLPDPAIRAYIEEGLSGRAAAARLKLSAATGVRWQSKWRETGAISPDVQGRPPGHGKLAAHRELRSKRLLMMTMRPHAPRT